MKILNHDDNGGKLRLAIIGLALANPLGNAFSYTRDNS